MIFMVLAIVFGALGLVGFFLRIFLKGKFHLLLLAGTGLCFCLMLAFLVIWARKTYGDELKSLATWTFLSLSLTIGALLFAPFARINKVANTIDMAAFLVLAILTIVLAIYLSKGVLQGPGVLPLASTSSASL